MLALTLAVGVLVGVTMGALGGGGAIITVPTLVYLLGQDAREATTGSLVVVGTTALVGAWQHRRTGGVRAGQGVLFGLLGVGGAVVGSRLAVGVPDPALLGGFAALLLVVAVVMTARRPRGVTDEPADERPVLTRTPRPVVHWRRLGLLALTASAVGLLTGFFGVGGGFVIVPALVIVLGLPMRAAIGTSLLVIVVTSAAALASRVGEVHLDWPVVAGFTAAALVGSVLGSRLSTRVPAERLTVAFTVLLVVVAGVMAAESVAAL